MLLIIFRKNLRDVWLGSEYDSKFFIGTLVWWSLVTEQLYGGTEFSKCIWLVVFREKWIFLTTFVTAERLEIPYYIINTFFFSWTIDIHFQGLRLFFSIIVSTTTLTCPITLFSCYPVICFRYYIIYTYGSSKSRPQ